MLVPLRDVLLRAYKEHLCIIAFNIYNFETARSVLNASQSLGSPVILAYGERYTDYIPIDILALIVRKLSDQYSIPIVLHLDHAHDVARIKAAIAVGFTSVMFDGSKLAFEENVKTTRQVVDLAHPLSISVEAELGYVASKQELNSTESTFVHHYTGHTEAGQFVAETDVDALAVSIGNIHGLRASMKKNTRLDLARLEMITAACKIPLVLHGGSGVSEEDLRRAVDLGICKLNVNTELSTGAVDEIRKNLRENEGEIRLEDLMTNSSVAMEKIATRFISSFSMAKSHT